MPEYKLAILVEAQDKASGPLGNVQRALGGLESIGKTAVAALGLSKLVDGLQDLGKEALNAVASYERLGLALTNLTARELVNTGQAQSMTDALEKAAPAARELQAWIQKLAIESPFTPEGVAQSLRLGMAFGFSSAQSKRLTQDLLDFAAGSGASEEVMQRIALSLGQVAARGKLSGMEVRELAMAGLPVTQILAKAFGTTTGKIQEMTEQGMIPAGKAIEAIARSLETDFAGAAKRQTTTWAGLMSTMSHIKTVGLRELTGGMFAAIQPGMAQLVGYLGSDAFMGQLRAFGTQAGQTLSQAMGAGAAMMGTLGKAGLGDWIEQVKAQWVQLIPALGSTGSVIGEISKQFGIAAASAVAFADNIATLVTFARDVLDDLRDWIVATFGGLGEEIAGLLAGTSQVGAAVQQLFSGDVVGAWRSARDASTSFKNAQTGVNRVLHDGGTALLGIEAHLTTAGAAFDATKTKYDSTVAAINDQATATTKLIDTETPLLVYGTNVRGGLKGTADAADDASTSFLNLGSDATSAMEKAAAAAGKLVDKARDFSIGLGTVGGAGGGALENLMKPGANGPFENLYRLQDVAVRGGASPFMAQLGVSQAQATEIVQKWQQGLLTADVTQFIDEGKLAELLKLQQLAEASQQAFIDRIGALAGSGGAYAGKLLGAVWGAQDEKGQTAAVAAAVGPVAEKSVNSLESAFAGQASGLEAIGRDAGGKIMESLGTALSGAYGAGKGWVEQLAAGVDAGLVTLQGALQRVADLFPHSPAKAGPLRKAPNWSAYMMAGLSDAAGMVAAGLGAGGGSARATPVYVSGDSYYVAVNDMASAGLLLAEMDSRRRERLNQFMGS